MTASSCHQLLRSSRLFVVGSSRVLFNRQRKLQLMQYQFQQKRTISFANLTTERTHQSKIASCPRKEDLKFGTTLTDHMLLIEWTKGTGWGEPRIQPYQDLLISPAASCLHYGLQCFEGMKAYRSLKDENDLLMFRPDKNMARLSTSMDRLHMPGSGFDRTELSKCIAELVRVDRDWIPSGEGYSLYIRPTVIATHKFLGLGAPDSILLFVILCPVGPYYKSGFQPVRLMADTPYVRAWPGGTGSNKVGGNYASTMKAQFDANEKGYDQVLWLFEDRVTEVGAMNVFFVFENGNGVKELVTPPLDRGDILPGVTRDSIVQLGRMWSDDDEKLVVSERAPTIAEVQERAQRGELLEAFGAGTAAVVTPICSIFYQGQDISIPATGELTQRFWNEITGIQYGKIPGPEGWSIKI